MVDDKLLILGGQEGDFMAKPGSPIFKCARRNEVVRIVNNDDYGEVAIGYSDTYWYK